MRDSSSFRTQTYHKRSTNPWQRADPERCVKNKEIRLRSLPAAAEEPVLAVNASWWKALCWEGWAVFTLHLTAIRFFFYLTFRTDSPPCHCSRNQICSDCVVNMYSISRSLAILIAWPQCKKTNFRCITVPSRHLCIHYVQNSLFVHSWFIVNGTRSEVVHRLPFKSF